MATQFHGASCEGELSCRSGCRLAHDGRGWSHICDPSGPEEDIKPLLEQLKAENVFVRELDTRGLAFHSPCCSPTWESSRRVSHSLLIARMLMVQNASHSV